MVKKVIILIILLVIGFFAVKYFQGKNANTQPIAPIPAKDVIHNPKATPVVTGPQTEGQFIQQANATPTAAVRRTY